MAIATVNPECLKRRTTWAILLASALCLTAAAASYVDEYNEDDLDTLRTLLASRDSPPLRRPSDDDYDDSTYAASSSDNDDDDEIIDVSLSDVMSDSPSSSAVAAPDNGLRPSLGRLDTARLAFHHWLKSKRISTASAPSTLRAAKRSPNCMRKCIAQGLLHPAQCHSLC